MLTLSINAPTARNQLLSPGAEDGAYSHPPPGLAKNDPEGLSDFFQSFDEPGCDIEDNAYIPEDDEDITGGGSLGNAAEEAGPSRAVKLYLASVKEKLAKEMQHGSLPTCYTQGQFWIYPVAPFFAMQKAAHSASGLQPNTLYHPLVFVWLPHLLQDDKFTCPMPNCQNHKKADIFLTIKG